MAWDKASTQQPPHAAASLANQKATGEGPKQRCSRTADLGLTWRGDIPSLPRTAHRRVPQSWAVPPGTCTCRGIRE